MDTPGGLVGELIEKGQQTTASATSDVVNTVQDQVGLKNEPTASQQTVNTTPLQQNQGLSQNTSETTSQQSDQSNEDTKELVREFYSPSDFVQNSPQQQEQLDTDQRLTKVRQQLHQELHNEAYYNDLTNPQKPKEESKVDQLESQKQQELRELQVKEAQKPLPLAVQRGQMSTEIRASAG